jgi:hypothetical protein
MQMTRLVFAGLLLALPALDGCSKPPAEAAPAAVAASPPSASVPSASVPEKPSREDARACDLVTPQEMSTILGTVVVGTEPEHKSSGKTECTYKPADGVSPYVEFSVEWGEAETAMRAAGAMGQGKPSPDDPYAGIGDQAISVGTSLWIRSGEDFVQIVFSGVNDAPAKARKIFDTAKARM